MLQAAHETDCRAAKLNKTDLIQQMVNSLWPLAVEHHGRSHRARHSKESDPFIPGLVRLLIHSLIIGIVSGNHSPRMSSFTSQHGEGAFELVQNCTAASGAAL